jgi:hypothetical protein
MDGKHNEIDIVLAYFQKFATFPLERLDILVQRLSRRRFLLPAGYKDSPQSEPPRWFKKIAQSFWQIEISITAADRIFSHLYRRTGWIFTSRPSLVLMGVICITGTAFFIMEEPNESYPLSFGGDSYFAGIIWVYFALIVSAALHKCGHAFACKAHGRTINAAGIVIYFGFPCLYVDTSDIWMADRKARIAVSLAGPAANVVFGSLFSLVVLLAPDLFFQHLLENRFPILSAGLCQSQPPPLAWWLLRPRRSIRNGENPFHSYAALIGPKENSRKREARPCGADMLLCGAGAGAYTVATGLLIVYLWEAHISDLVAKSLNGTLMRGELLYSLVVVLILTPFILGLALPSLGIIRQIIESVKHLSGKR